jgi:hypothetical protein
MLSRRVLLLPHDGSVEVAVLKSKDELGLFPFILHPSYLQFTPYLFV